MTNDHRTVQKGRMNNIGLLLKGAVGAVILLLLLTAGEKVRAQMIGKAVKSVGDRNQAAFFPTANPLPKRLEPNVLLIDYCLVNGKTESHWSKAAGSSFVYEFVVDEDFCESFDSAKVFFMLVPDGKYGALTVNGQRLTTDNYKWQGRSFLKIDLSGSFKKGKNTVEIKSETAVPVYLLGEFLLKSAEKGFVIKRDWQFLFPDSYNKEIMNELYQFRTGTAGPINEKSNPLRRQEMVWRAQGLPFYQGAVSYREIFEIAWPRDAVFYVYCPKFGDPEENGSLNAAKISFRINNRFAGYFEPKKGMPIEFPMASLIKSRTNDVLITLFGDPELLFRVPDDPPKTMPAGKDYKISNFGLIEPFYIIKKTN